MVNLRLIQLLPRQECVAGKQYYRCASPQFQGCCSVDACASNGCPDEDTSTTNSNGAAGGGRNNNGGRSSSTTTRTTSRPASASSPTATSPRSSNSDPNSSPATVTVTNAVLSTIVSTAPGGRVTTTMTTVPMAETQRPSPESSSSSRVGPIVGAVVGVLVLSLVLAAIYLCCWRPRRRKRRRRHMQNVYSKAGSQPYSPDPNDQLEGMDRSVKERDSGFWSIFSNKIYKPLRESKSRRLTTTSEATWLNPPQPSPSAITTSPYSPDSILQQTASPELDGTSTIIPNKNKRPSRLSELPGSSPELSSSLTSPPPGYGFYAELPADEEVTVKARSSSSSLPKTKKDKGRVSPSKKNSNTGDIDEETRKRQTLLISPTLPEHDHPLPSPPRAQTRSDTQPIITVNGIGIDMGTGVSSSEDSIRK